eukprot:g26912.t1
MSYASRPTSAGAWSRPTSASVTASRPASAGSYQALRSRPTSATAGRTSRPSSAVLRPSRPASAGSYQVHAGRADWPGEAPWRLRLLRQSEDLPGELAALKTTAEIHLSRGDTEPCLRLLQEVISLAHDSGDVLDEVDAHVTAARVRTPPAEATKAALEGSKALKASGDLEGAAEALLEATEFSLVERKADEAKDGEEVIKVKRWAFL